MTRGRTGLVLLTAFLVQLIVVAAVGNQKVAESIAKFTARHSTTQSAFPRAALFYSWRFSPMGQDNFRLYPSQLLGLLTLFVVCAALTFAVIRGSITFGRAFFGVWMAVIIAAVADGMVQRVVLKNYGQYGGYGNGGHKLFYAAFGGTGYDVMAGILLGLVVALVAALVAVISRRPAGPVSVVPFAPQPDAGPDTEAPPPYFGDEEPRRPSPDSEATRSLSMQKVHDSVRDEATPERRPDPAAAASTSVLPRLESGDETTRLSRPPAPEDSAGQPPRRSERDQPTTQFPRPPDDEDLGHQPD
ncbi:MAG: hypothetical protein M3Y06_07195 [Actinomycetota bacterium]|nr:hypothetical protein [Actinomycetota bacterium]